MKKFLPGLIVGLLLGAGATWILLSHPAAEAPAEKPAGPDITTGSAVISKQLAALGLAFAAPQSVELAPEIKGYGRVLDPTPLAGLVADLRTAQAAANAAASDVPALPPATLETLKNLYQREIAGFVHHLW